MLRLLKVLEEFFNFFPVIIEIFDLRFFNLSN